MRGKAVWCGGLALGVALVAGCHHDKYKLKTKAREEYVIPPNEPRFDNPPEADYKPPVPKKDGQSPMGGGSGGQGGGKMGGPAR